MTRILAVSFELDTNALAVLEDAIAGAAQIVELAGKDARSRKAVLQKAEVVLMKHPTYELARDQIAAIGKARLIQLMTAGIDFMPIDDLPPGVPVASNAGAYSEPIAEHALALAAAKRMLIEHGALARGMFNQQTHNRMLAGMVCGIVGYGGIGQATARLMRGLRVKIHAVNRSGATSDPVDWIGTTQQLDALLVVADVLVVSAPLTRTTQGLIGGRELSLMKQDAILVNLARGEIIDEAALFAHLKAHPNFTACIDAWWIEPVRHGAFRLDYPFLTLPNVIGSPHNSASVPQTSAIALRMAGRNCRRQLNGEQVLNLIGPQDGYR